MHTPEIDNIFDTFTPFAYWLAGFIAADGHINKSQKYGQNKWSLSQSGPEGFEVLDDIKKHLSLTQSIYTASTSGRDNHSIVVCSNRMVASLEKVFGIAQQKTLRLTWPELENEKQHRCFLRGYVAGDGHVSECNNGKGSTYLCISFAGTNDLTIGAMGVIPFDCNRYEIKRAENCFEIRFNGENAYRFGKWLYQEDLPVTSIKYRLFLDILEDIKKDPPRWLVSRRKRKKAKHLLNDHTVQETADKIDVAFQTIYYWKRQGYL